MIPFWGNYPQPTKQDWIDLIAIYRVIVRARTGIRFTSTDWAK